MGSARFAILGFDQRFTSNVLTNMQRRHWSVSRCVSKYHKVAVIWFTQSIHFWLAGSSSISTLPLERAMCYSKVFAVRKCHDVEVQDTTEISRTLSRYHLVSVDFKVAVCPSIHQASRFSSLSNYRATWDFMAHVWYCSLLGKRVSAQIWWIGMPCVPKTVSITLVGCSYSYISTDASDSPMYHIDHCIGDVMQTSML